MLQPLESELRIGRADVYTLSTMPNVKDYAVAKYAREFFRGKCVRLVREEWWSDEHKMFGSDMYRERK